LHPEKTRTRDMPTRKLTTVSIPHLAEGEWYDAVLPGLILRVGKKRRSWSFRYRSGGSYRRVPLGHFPAIELGEARDTARRVIERAERGMPVEAPAPHPRSSDVLTLGGLIDRYETLRKREGRKIKTLAKSMRVLRHHLRSCLALPAAQFSKSDLRAARDTLIEAGTAVAANRMLDSLGALMRWAAEEDLIESNFVSAIRRTPRQKRERVLSKQEIAAIWRACDKLGGHEVARSFGRLVRFLLVSAQRRGEAAALRCGHILDGVWRQTENKANRPHNIPLPPLALALVGHGEARDLVFEGLPGREIGGFARPKRLLDQVSGVTNWRLHDLRRTAATNMQELGIRNEVVQSILNHSLPGVAAVYLRSELEKQKAEALATWATALARIVGQGTNKLKNNFD
jgi:integrase